VDTLKRELQQNGICRSCRSWISFGMIFYKYAAPLALVRP
jgi:hypothetical protein